jgi:hypothetical protein
VHEIKVDDLIVALFLCDIWTVILLNRKADFQSLTFVTTIGARAPATQESNL